MKRIAKAIGFRSAFCLLLLAILGSAACWFDNRGPAPSPAPDSS
jgi:hypothetical protein